MKTIAKHVSAGILAVLLLDAGVGQAYAQVTQNIGIKSWANDVMSGYDNGGWVVNGTQFNPFVGNINNLPGKTRMLLKFDISNISGTVTAADLDLTSFAREGTNVVQVSSYNNNETSATFTSEDIAASLANSTPITTFTVPSGSGLQLHWNLDITSAVQTAKANGYSYVSFLLYSETANAITEAPFDSYVFFLAKNGGNGVYDPNITVTATAIPVPPTFAEWASTNAGGQAANLDWDNDGVTNGVEFFMNAAPGFTANPSFVGNTVTWSNGGNISASTYGTQFVVQTSSDLVTWEDVAEGDLNTNTSGPAGSLSYSVDPANGPAKQFVRLKVTPN